MKVAFFSRKAAGRSRVSAVENPTVSVRATSLGPGDLEKAPGIGALGALGGVWGSSWSRWVAHRCKLLRWPLGSGEYCARHCRGVFGRQFEGRWRAAKSICPVATCPARVIRSPKWTSSQDCRVCFPRGGLSKLKSESWTPSQICCIHWRQAPPHRAKRASSAKTARRGRDGPTGGPRGIAD